MGVHGSGGARAVLKQGDIYLVSLDPSLGHEQQGTRPVLIISSDRFQRTLRLPIIVPISNGANVARVAGFTVSLAGCGTKTTGVVRCDQPRPIDIVARNGRRLEAVPPFVLEEVIAKVLTIFE